MAMSDRKHKKLKEVGSRKTKLIRFARLNKPKEKDRNMPNQK